MMEEGRTFAHRERTHTPGDPARPVELVKDGPPHSQKAKVRWLDGEYEGLEEWVPKVRLVVPWDEKEALLEDERRMFAALEASGDVYGTTTSGTPPSWGRFTTAVSGKVGLSGNRASQHFSKSALQLKQEADKLKCLQRGSPTSQTTVVLMGAGAGGSVGI
jgi:hypothetical protein